LYRIEKWGRQSGGWTTRECSKTLHGQRLTPVDSEVSPAPKKTGEHSLKTNRGRGAGLEKNPIAWALDWSKVVEGKESGRSIARLQGKGALQGMKAMRLNNYSLEGGVLRRSSL